MLHFLSGELYMLHHAFCWWEGDGSAYIHIEGLIEKRRNSGAWAMKFRLFAFHTWYILAKYRAVCITTKLMDSAFIRTISNSTFRPCQNKYSPKYSNRYPWHANVILINAKHTILCSSIWNLVQWCLQLPEECADLYIWWIKNGTPLNLPGRREVHKG